MNNTQNEFAIQILNPGTNQETLIIRNARLMFKNFAGQKTDFNREGDRNFAIVIDDPEAAYELQDHGWNVREKPPRDADSDPLFTLKINVRFDQKRPPQIWMVKGNKKTLLNDSNVGMLDISRVEKAMASIRAYRYNRNGSEGISAYLNELYAHIEAGIFDEEYANYQTDTSSVSSSQTGLDEDAPF